MKIIKFLCFYKFAYHLFAVNCQRRLSYRFENNTKCSRSRAECLLMHGRMSHVMIRLEVGHLIIPNDFANTKNVRELIPPLHRSTKMKRSLTRHFIVRFEISKCRESWYIRISRQTLDFCICIELSGLSVSWLAYLLFATMAWKKKKRA